ncbi:hypothetical protein AAC387_Pa01g3152 [Persea americana]|eukprot:TRINITY_DN23860_c0_g1_i1.p1 TRINITY_DN23860_c0_g1~~TRINITY_DN23860_c0_g1_i1.p1  ORF type:complete len:327 (+),score=62.12 TRINITY_DN23860_c0_g1_i1:338-1318(+)
MAREMNRKCSHCGKNGHNLRTCSDKGLKLFGVRILSPDEEEEVMRKSASMGNLASLASSEQIDHGYLSDGLLHSSGRGKRERKRGVPWTKEEHRTFLEGLEKLGKGDWRGISRKFVMTRTPAQVASHAQKYFLRHTMFNNKKRRSSLFDMAINDTAPTSDTGPALSQMRTNEIPEVSNLQHQDNYVVGNTASIVTQTPVHSIQTSPTLPPIEACGEALNVNGVRYMSGFAAENQTKDATFQISQILSSVPAPGSSYFSDIIPLKPHEGLPCSPNFLRLSFNPSQATMELPAMGNSDLELSIAPPRQFNSTRLSSGASTLSGAIRVI